MKPLSVAEGLAMQAEHLAQWRIVLNDDAYGKLAEWLRLHNEFGYQDGYAVVRGDELSQFVAYMRCGSTGHDAITKEVLEQA